MNTKLGLLLGALVVQLLLVALFLFNDASGDAGGVLLTLNAEEVDEFVVQDADTTVAITRTADGWLVDGWPADALKADELVNTFVNLAAPWPVSTSSSGVERFEVEADNYQRRIAFRNGGADRAVVYLGTSPGYQRVHARVDGSDDVFAVSFSNFKAPTKADDWLDKGLIASRGAPQSVTSSRGFSLARVDSAWLIDGQAADEDAAQTFADRFANLRVLSVAESLPEGTAESGTLTAEDSLGEFVLTLWHESDEDDYFIRSSRQEGTFKVATYIAEQLLSEKDSLLPDEMPALELEEQPGDSVPVGGGA